MDRAEKADARQFLSFQLGKEIFAIDVIKAQEILDLTEVTKVPQTPPFMLGVTNLRGQVVPVIDLRRKFGMPEVERTRDTCIIVMEVKVDGEDAVVGAVVDAVLEVLELGEEEIGPPPRIGTKLRTEFIKGMGNRDERFLILLDIDRVFSSDEMSLVQDAAIETVA